MIEERQALCTIFCRISSLGVWLGIMLGRVTAWVGVIRVRASVIGSRTILASVEAPLQVAYVATDTAAVSQASS